MKKRFIIPILLIAAISVVFALRQEEDTPKKIINVVAKGTLKPDAALDAKPVVKPDKRMPKIEVIDENGEKFTLKVSEVKADVKVVGSIALTTIDVVFKNELDRILEGELNFPLADGQTISRFAMDLNGKLREGVVVEKAKGRVAFESVVRQKIDPALLEQTVGNNFKARVYPIPAKGTKRVVMAYEEELPEFQDGMTYRLPLNYQDKLDNFSLNAVVYERNTAPNAKDNDLPGVDFKKEGKGFATSVRMKNYVADKHFEFILPSDGAEPMIIIEERDGKTYFLLKYKPALYELEKELPKKITMFYDISNSSKGRDFDLESEFIEEYFAKLGSFDLELVPFADIVLPSAKFKIQNGNSKDIIEKLRGYTNDGGTQLGAIELNKYDCDEVLLFSDGISNFGAKEMVLGNKPVICVNSNQSAEHSYLKYIATSSSGQYINLLENDPAVSAELLLSEPYSFIKAVGTGVEIDECYPGINTVVKRNFSLSGIMNKDDAEITLYFGFGGEITHKEKLFLIKEKSLTTSGLIPRLWAQKKLAQLDMRYEDNKKEITELGKEFSIVTRNTSLIILDRVQDYIRHKIVPPEELQNGYFAAIINEENKKLANDSSHSVYVLNLMNKYRGWWNTEFPLKKDTVKMPSGAVGGSPIPAQDMVAFDEVEIRNVLGAPIERAVSNAPVGSSGGSNALAPRSATNRSMGSNALMPSSKSKKGYRYKSSSIKVKAYDSKAAYNKKLKEASKEEFEKIYFEFKKEYGNNPGFYLDAADIAYDKEMSRVALRILSNIAEMKLENHGLLRILGQRLKQIGEYKYAVSVFRDVLKIREEEPHSYRDLALALAADKEYIEAADLLYKVVSTKWDRRFPEIELIALNELNNIISKSDESLNVQDYDLKLLEDLPLDVRVVLNWDTDNCDIDLWVIDPNGEKCFYSHPKTRIGGFMSKDFTGGYGPEIYRIKKAIPGKYIVKANYYGQRTQKMTGSVTLQMTLYTGYGRDHEEKKEVTLRLENVKEVVDVGEFEFGE